MHLIFYVFGGGSLLQRCPIYVNMSCLQLKYVQIDVVSVPVVTVEYPISEICMWIRSQ